MESISDEGTGWPYNKQRQWAQEIDKMLKRNEKPGKNLLNACAFIHRM